MSVIRATVERTICEYNYVRVPDNWHQLTRAEQCDFLQAAIDSGEVLESDICYGVDYHWGSLQF